MASTVHKEPEDATTHAQPLSCLWTRLDVGKHASSEELGGISWPNSAIVRTLLRGIDSQWFSTPVYVKIYCNYCLNRAARAAYSILSGQEERSNRETSKAKWGGGGGWGQRYFRDPIVRLPEGKGRHFLKKRYVNRDWGVFRET